jgi:hypothetical protein
MIDKCAGTGDSMQPNTSSYHVDVLAKEPEAEAAVDRGD